MSLTRRWAVFQLFARLCEIYCRIMNTATPSTTERKADVVQTSAENNKGFFRSGLSMALFGACGVGLQVGTIITDYKHSNPDSLVGDILLGTIFFALAAKGSFRVLKERNGGRDLRL